MTGGVGGTMSGGTGGSTSDGLTSTGGLFTGTASTGFSFPDTDTGCVAVATSEGRVAFF